MCGFLCLPVAVSCDVQCVVGALDESINVSSRPLAFCFHLRRQEKDSKLYVCHQIPTLVLLGMRETVPRVGTADKVTGRFSAQDGQVSVVVGFGLRGGNPGGLEEARAWQTLHPQFFSYPSPPFLCLAKL